VLRKIFPLVTAACLALAPTASGAQRDSWTQAGPQWAKVNLCAPLGVGVRASLPGDGGGGQMAARFTLQWLNPATQAWEPVKGVATSHWIDAGSADVSWSQVGYTFDLDPIPPAAKFSLRGVAELQLAGGSAATLTTGSCTLGG
jgi:hypothetical protein